MTKEKKKEVRQALKQQNNEKILECYEEKTEDGEYGTWMGGVKRKPSHTLIGRNSGRRSTTVVEESPSCPITSRQPISWTGKSLSSGVECCIS